MSVAQVALSPSHVGRPAFPSGPCPALRAVNPAGPPPKLLDRVRQALLTRHYSRRTVKAYVGWIVSRPISSKTAMTSARFKTSSGTATWRQR